MSAIITFDDSLWPLLVIRVTGAMSDKDFEAYLARSSAMVERGERYVSITDLSKAGLPSAEQRRLQAEWLREYEAALGKQVLGNASIITSAPIRLAVSLVFSIKPLPMPNVAVSDMDSALRYVIGKLEEGGFVSEAERVRSHYFGLPGIRAS